MKKLKFILPAGMALAAIAFISLGAGFEDKESVKDSLKQVSVQTAEIGTIERVGQYSGIVKGANETQLSPKISGTIRSLLKNEGDFVRAGELLATIDSSELQAESALAKENISANESSLKETGDYYDQLVDEAKSALKKSERAYDIAKESSDQDSEDLAARDLEKAQEAVSSAKRLRDLQISSTKGQLDLSKKQLGVADAYLKNSRIVAPFSGVITAKNSQLGSLAAPGSPIYSLSSSDKKEVLISVAGEEAERMEVGQAVKISLEGQDETEGKIISISPVSDFKDRKSSIRIAVSEEVRLGSYVQISILLEKKDSILVVPTEAIVKKYHDTFIYVSENGKAAQRAVETGIAQNGSTEIVSGLSAGEILITKGQHYLRNGDTIGFQN
ncbi:MAG TPA: hypothetical protein DCX32_03030 [Candidatus Moranbacteria bacterium]|nr:MAG: RND family efflux transporter, MFP subunit [Candidatus Moranbacteria bacterium GW2011_GWC2_45_10]KKT95218.1 MAG: RND family efflux transporter, MFP subunit [Parcubacteria group bacterium GW2011_GWC1_45_14]HAV11493.1 hypothetical protein [Candidatus Moranbacteria bacterium]